ncbi:MAG TPA: hypothetical protein VH475_21010 [Tepidisphaeraceae bacterium]
MSDGGWIEVPIGVEPEAQRFEPTPRQLRIFREVIDAIRFVGIVLVVVGVIVAGVMVEKRGAMARRAPPVAGLVAAPGLLYLVAAVGLSRRRYWAWVMSLIVTVLLMVALLATCVYFAAFARAGASAGLACPTVMYFSMPCLILLYMLRAVPVVRDAGLLVRKGFHVLPAAVAAGRAPAESSPQVVVLKPGEAADVTSPSPSPPAPSPPTPPPRG